MITEDYISFETAKLLKEKGFDGKCDYLYVDGKLVRAMGCACNWNDGETLFADYKNECSAPTLQMAMKWLRVRHHIDINVRTYYLNYLKPNDTRYYSGKILKGSEDVIHTIYSKDTYEEVCETAIKYCLENLI